MNKKTLIICAVFALIISCKNYAIKDLEQKTKGQVNGFIDKISDSVKNKITSSGSKVDEVAKKLQEEDKIKGVEENNKDELMLGDDSNGGGLIPPPVLLENSQEDNTPILKAAGQSGGQQEEKVKKVEGSEAKVEGKEEKQENTEEQNKQELAKQEEEQQKRKAEQEKQKREEEQERKAKAEKEAKEKAERQKQEEQKKEAEKRQVDNEIRTLTGKIDEINGNIDVIKEQTSVGAQGVIDRITGPVYDDFTDDENSAIYHTWNLEDENTSELGKLLKKLGNTRDELRTKLNEGNQKYILDTKSSEPKLKENVMLSDIKSDLERLKSELEEVKGYLEDNSNFETIKEYIVASGYDYDDED
ncbi:ErpC protein [Borreliella carolinensis]|uniref:ErpC protein n=1 Tax=Borreliella carolinensis TaxID=478174 RepID=A0ACD5GLG2_9SPIR